MKSLEHRVPPPVVALITIAVMWAIARTTYVVPISQTVRYVTTTLLLTMGVSTVLLGVLTFRKAGTTINPVEIERASALVTGGIFQLTRNPMYLGLCIVLTGVAAWLSAPFALLAIAMFVLFISRYQIQPEERALLALFGTAYEEYCRRTRRWI